MNQFLAVKLQILLIDLPRFDPIKIILGKAGGQFLVLQKSFALIQDDFLLRQEANFSSGISFDISATDERFLEM